MLNKKIDIVIPWVDGSDITWQKELRKTVENIQTERQSLSNIRYESWDNIPFLFRAIEKCLPWINKIVFVTCGHVPDSVNFNNPKLLHVKHSDYLPSEYLPTFNSNTIEMNLHRINELSENFILFNDDTFPLQYIPEEYYFRNDLVCDEAVENIITTATFGPVANMARYTQVNNMFIINKYFKKREVQAKHPEQWFNEDYGDRMERTESLKYWNDFPGFYDPHLPNALKKSTLSKIWKLEGDILDKASRNRFRSYSDVTQYLIRYWQLCEGNFYPRRTKGKVFFVDKTNYIQVANSIRNKEYQMVCFNENCTPEEFEFIRNEINSALEELFPEKSSFE